MTGRYNMIRYCCSITSQRNNGVYKCHEAKSCKTYRSSRIWSTLTLEKNAPCPERGFLGVVRRTARHVTCLISKKPPYVISAFRRRHSTFDTRTRSPAFICSIHYTYALPTAFCFARASFHSTWACSCIASCMAAVFAAYALRPRSSRLSAPSTTLLRQMSLIFWWDRITL